MRNADGGVHSAQRLRNAQDPENAAFLADVNRGRMPAELMGPDGNPEGDVHIIDKSGEQYVPPKAKPFSGEGLTMRDEAAAAAAPVEAVGGASSVLLELRVLEHHVQRVPVRPRVGKAAHGAGGRERHFR